MRQCFPESYDSSGWNVSVELDLSKYATKANLKGATGIDTSMFASKIDLACSETKVNDLHMLKLW